MQPGIKVVISSPSDAIEYLKERSEEHPITGCWLWKCGCMGDGRPRLTFGPGTPARRWAWEAINGRRAGKRQIMASCGQQKCVAPEHMRAMTPAEKNAFLGAAGRFSTLSVLKSRRATSRRKSPNSPDTVKKARQMRAGGALLREIADECNASIATVHKWVSGKTWRNEMPGASVFSLGR